MKYSLFFTLIVVSLIFYVIVYEDYYLIYLLLTFSVLSMAYFFKKPYYVAGKSENGRINGLLYLVNLPWLVFSVIILHLVELTSKEPRISKITNFIDIGSYPMGAIVDNYDLIIDLTAEFPRSRFCKGAYRCFPNLDGIPLSNLNFPEFINDKSRVLIHCAQGHGRSATYCSLLMVKLEVVNNGLDALNIILKNRPQAKPSKEQIEQIKSFQKKLY